ncbi:ThiF family adenylyltransferase [Saccharopolyspora hattusasensis]|uniref:ThiF family adenylyltransferase n=1 Tax=Saccharopolyspora hattusasensis TaxID=1128679 RepID=UPI003D95BAB9
MSRNLDILTEREQAVLRAATVLVAGCGSVGGAVVEPLARMGVTRFRLADPDRFDVSNLNRQACVVADVGLPKPEVLARRVVAISPTAEVRTYPGGLTLENLDEALDGAHVAFDAIDPAMSAWVKYQLHERAARRGIPVVAGVDWGGKPALFVFDYRRNPLPFHGKATAEAHRDNRLWDSVRWFGRTHFPSDYLPVMSDRLANGGTWPQISYCVMGLGALGSRVVLNLLMNRRVKSVVTVDLHAAAMPRAAALAHRARMPLELARTLWTIRQVTRKGGSRPVRSGQRERELPPELTAVLGGARLAPSAYNSQPWRFEIVGNHTVQLALNGARWPTAHPDRLGWAENLGCTLGALSYLAYGEWEAHEGALTDQNWSAGRFRLDRLRDDFLTRQGVLGARSTYRGDMLSTPIDRTTLKQVEKLCTDRNVSLETMKGSQARSSLLGRTARDRSTLIGNEDELWAWVRKRADTEFGRSWFGKPHDLLGISGFAGRLASALAGSAIPVVAKRHVLAGVVEHGRARQLRNCGAVLVLRGPRQTVADRISAGETLMQLWLSLVEQGYAAQPLLGEFGGLGTPSTRDASGDNAVLAVLRVGKGTRPPTTRVARCPLATSVKWAE